MGSQNLTYAYSLTKTTDEKFELRMKKEFDDTEVTNDCSDLNVLCVICHG